MKTRFQKRMALMTNKQLSEKAESYLQILCLDLPDRRVGSDGNQAATRFFADVLNSFAFRTESQEFNCLDWEQGAVRLTSAGGDFDVFTSPYSLGCQLKAPLVMAGKLEELAESQAAGQILLLHGVAATGRNPELAGGMYPFPLIEDGDFDIPSVYMTEEEGKRLAKLAGQEVALEIEATRIPSKGYNVIGRKGLEDGHERLVVCAHIDAKDDTPGALDNAAGVIVLLLLAELMQDYSGRLNLELVALNGEDHYSAQGQKDYLKHAMDSFGEVVLAVNIDAAGYIKGQTEYSLYECPELVARLAHQAFAAGNGFAEGAPWYQSDHSIFIQNGVPAMAITSAHFMKLSTEITHTQKDRPELVDTGKLVNIALALQALILEIERE
jgi:aminopeptidase YwaD